MPLTHAIIICREIDDQTNHKLRFAHCGMLPFSHFYPQPYNSLPLQQIGRHCNQQCAIFRLCRKHTAWIQPKSVFDNFQKHALGTSLDCKVCKLFNDVHNAVKPSRYESRTYAALAKVSANNPDLTLQPHEWHTDAHVLPTTYKVNHSSVDVYVPKHKLCIMVDGEHHFPNKRRRNVSKQVKAQQEIDHEFNRVALAEGFSVLRLHYGQLYCFEPPIFHVLLACKRGACRNKIEFSKSFDNEYRNRYSDHLLSPIESEEAIEEL